MPARPAFAWSRTFRAFAFKGKPLRGVHPTLTSTFYPHYTFAAANLGPLSSHSGDGCSKAENKVTKYKAGKRAGILVDQELKRIVALVVKYKIPTSALVSYAAQTSYAAKPMNDMGSRDKGIFCKRLAPATTKLLQTMHKLELTPLGSQMVVGCPLLRIATALDVLCCDAQRRHVVIQIKTGFSGYYFRHTSTPMCHIVPPQNDSVCNQHQLQLLLELELYRRTYPVHATGAYGLLLRVDSFGVDVLPLKAWTVRVAGRVFSILQRTTTTSKPRKH